MLNCVKLKTNVIIFNFNFNKMSDHNDCSGSESGEFLKGKKKALKKITKLGKRPYNKGKNNQIKNPSN